ncbi:MAG: TetR/AcrR family transcriptional regulator [Erysipelotrichaceae bacterium]|nr:TetR/AcrR family transcriptional regulator [Erysipelotrichaceae bacterium]
MAKTTKIEILRAALEIFARDGYEKTNIKDIAEAVGLVKSGIYKHYENKEALWNATIDMMENYYEEYMKANKENLKIPQSVDELYQMTMGMINFTLHDKDVILTRKILAQEQFRNEKIKDLANKHFVYDMEGMFKRIFKEMMEKGILKNSDPDILALSYTTPISVLIRMCDRDPDKEMEVMMKIENFVRYFIEENKNQGQENS